MTGTELIEVVAFAVISLATAGLAIFATGRFFPSRSPAVTAIRKPAFFDVTRRYAFREGYLLSDLDPNDAFLDAEVDRSRAFEALSQTFSELNPEILPRLQALTTRGEAFLLTCPFGTDQLTVSGRKEDDHLVLTVAPAETVPGREAVDSAVLASLTGEAEELRNTIDRSPMVVWKRDAQGQIQWANAGYFALLDRLTGSEDVATWPVPQIFEIDEGAVEDAQSPRRAELEMPDGADPLHFDVSQHRQPDGTTIVMALPVDALVAAETALRSFVQTLSQTFAQLPVGLAVFDRTRKLVLFNPALTVLSALDIQFLSNRPGLVEFLDALRDRQRVPEPKDYRSWRTDITRLEQGAKDGSYQEIWSLPNGDSVRVIGRPHPDGAVAFMFEDITSQMSLTRSFRSDLDLYQSVLDHLPGAVAVFSNEGRLVLGNASYAALWQTAPTPESSLSEAITLWRLAAEPTRVWADIKAFAGGQVDRIAWRDEVHLRDGTTLTCDIASLAGGATLVRFDTAASDVKAQDRAPEAPLLAALAQASGSARVAYEQAETPPDFGAQGAASRRTGTDPD